jgi:hypothetical protein
VTDKGASGQAGKMNKRSVWILGGIAGLLLAILACLGPIVVTLAVIQIPLRTNPGLEQGMKILQNDPAVIKVFGTPVRQGIIVMGTISTTLHGSGFGNLWTPISGPKNSGEATIHVQKPEDGPWVVTSMSIRVNSKHQLVWNANKSSSGFISLSTPPPGKPSSPTNPPAITVPTP